MAAINSKWSKPGSCAGSSAASHARQLGRSDRAGAYAYDTTYVHARTRDNFSRRLCVHSTCIYTTHTFTYVYVRMYVDVPTEQEFMPEMCGVVFSRLADSLVVGGAGRPVGKHLSVSVHI